VLCSAIKAVVKMIHIFKYYNYLIYLKVGFQAHQQSIDHLEVIKKVILLFCILCNIDEGHSVFSSFVFKYDIFSELLLKFHRAFRNFTVVFTSFRSLMFNFFRLEKMYWKVYITTSSRH
jgi:hypothetical protein